MMTNSGCFGGGKAADPIDDLEEASETVTDILNSENTPAAAADTTAVADVANLLGEYARRVRLLTWAVVAIVVVLVIKEVK